MICAVKWDNLQIWRKVGSLIFSLGHWLAKGGTARRLLLNSVQKEFYVSISVTRDFIIDTSRYLPINAQLVSVSNCRQSFVMTVNYCGLIYYLDFLTNFRGAEMRIKLSNYSIFFIGDSKLASLIHDKTHRRADENGWIENQCHSFKWCKFS